MSEEGLSIDENGMSLIEIDDPRDSDVLCGRGGAALRHPGNQTYRRLVHLNKGLYITCLKAEKFKISRSIVAAIREQDGRFLERNTQKGTWYDIGDKKAIEKTSQALREGQPKLRQQIVELGTGASGTSSALVDNSFPTGQMYQMSDNMVHQQNMMQQQMDQQQHQQNMVAMQQQGLMDSMSEMPPPPARDGHDHVFSHQGLIQQMTEMEMATPTIQEEPGSLHNSIAEMQGPDGAPIIINHHQDVSALSLLSDFSNYNLGDPSYFLPSGAVPPPPYHMSTPNSLISAGAMSNLSNISATFSTGDSAKRNMDRRKHFARMKFSRAPSGRSNTSGGSNRQIHSSNKQLYASNKSLDGMPDIHLVDSNPSLFSNPTADSYGRVPDVVANIMESRRSLMSGLSRISDTSDMNSIFSDLSRKIGNVSTRSIAMSEISVMDEQDRLDDLDPDTTPSTRMDDF